MRILDKNTKKFDYSLKEYHRLMYNHYCNPLTNQIGSYIFDKSSGVLDEKGVEVYENDIVETVFHKHAEKNLKLIQVVKFEKGCFVLKPLIDDESLEFECTYTYTNLYVADKITVIDNTHQNNNSFTINQDGKQVQQ